MFSELQKQLHI